MKLAQRLLVLLGVGAALAAPAFQALTGWGLTASEFSRAGDETLRVEGYAFSIWGVIYTALAAYALRRLFWPDRAPGGAADATAAIASLGCGLWILAAGANLRWLTVLIIVSALAAALAGLLRLTRQDLRLGWLDRATALWPLALLAGWLTVASLVNLLTVLTAEGLIAPPMRTAAAIAGIGVAAAVAGLTLLATGAASYAAPVAWGLVGAFVAERNEQPAAAYAALACAAALVLAALLASRRRRLSLEPA